ncbi:MAG: hypothetical protein OEX12_14425 [Gammaproteobacteria bacterium]|nr:hypothetical protein [Gammaproteobacteria bacterium]
MSEIRIFDDESIIEQSIVEVETKNNTAVGISLMVEVNPKVNATEIILTREQLITALHEMDEYEGTE